MPSGVYDHSRSRKSREIRTCIRPGCDNTREVIITSELKYCSRECYWDDMKGKPSWREGKPSWSKGLTKETDPRIMKMAEGVSKSKKGRPCWFKDMTYEEAFGVDKAREILKKRGPKHSTSLKKFYQNGGRVWNKDLTKEMNDSLMKLSRINSENSKNLWQDPAYVKKQMIARNVCPNKTENFLSGFFQDILLNEYKFVGDGQFILAGKCPDFVNVNGQKKIIELFGEHVHKPEEEQQRIDLFAQYGYQTLIIWYKELQNLDLVKQKVLEFNNV